MKYTQILSKIWLSEIESKIYLDLLENNSSNIIEISNRTKLHRPLIYKTIPYLIESGLISKILKWKRNYYKAESPEHLKNLFDNLSNKFSNILPELDEIYKTWDSKPNIKILQWKKWIKEVFEDVVINLKKWDTYYRYSSRSNFWENFLPPNYRELRDKKQIQRMVITSENLEKQKTKRVEREIVSIPKGFDLFDDNIVKIIYADKIAIIDYNTLISFIIQNKILAKFEEKLFKFMYKFLKQIKD